MKVKEFPTPGDGEFWSEGIFFEEKRGLDRGRLCTFFLRLPLLAPARTRPKLSLRYGRTTRKRKVDARSVVAFPLIFALHIMASPREVHTRRREHRSRIESCSICCPEVVPVSA